MSDLKLFPCQMSISFLTDSLLIYLLAEAGRFQSQKTFPNTKTPNTAKQQQQKRFCLLAPNISFLIDFEPH